MARFLQAKKLPMKWRRPHLNRYKAQLREALLNPALSTEQREQIKDHLSCVGQEKPYTKLALKFETNIEDSAVQTVEELLAKHTKDELLTIAENEGIEVYPSWTKTQIAEAIQARS